MDIITSIEKEEIDLIKKIIAFKIDLDYIIIIEIAFIYIVAITIVDIIIIDIVKVNYNKDLIIVKE